MMVNKKHVALIGFDIMFRLATVSILMFWSTFAASQSPTDFNPPDVKIIDKVGVNLISGLPQFNLTPVSIGAKGNSFALNFQCDDGVVYPGQTCDGYYGAIYQSKIIGPPSLQDNGQYNEMTVRMFSKAEKFQQVNGAWSSGRQTGARLIPYSDGSFEYVSREGIRYLTNTAIRGFWCNWANISTCFGAANSAITKVIYPDGRELSINYDRTGWYAPIRSVVRNDGFQLRYTYNLSSYDSYKGLLNVTAVNMSVDTCDPTAISCSYSKQWPTATFVSGAVTSITDAAGQTVKYYHQPVDTVTRVASVKWPSSPVDTNVSFGYGSMRVCVDGGGYWSCTITREGLVTSATTGATKWTYSYSQPGLGAPPYTSSVGLWNSTTTGPEGFSIFAQHNVITGRTGSVVASNGRFGYDGAETNHITSASDAEGRNFSFGYDGRSNVTEKRQVAVVGSGAADAVHTAGYDTVCTYPLKCNKPNWIRDPNGYQTDLEYDTVHGGILKETLPPDSSGIRPQKRYSYAQRYAWIKNSGGSYVSAATPIWLLTQVSYCRAGAASSVGCALGGADEVITTYDYGPDTGPNNLFLRGQAVTADGQSLRTCYGYDVLGNKISETTPNAGLTSCP
jgi:YD repeat-containing protein